jgi:hypothetical protein
VVGALLKRNTFAGVGGLAVQWPDIPQWLKVSTPHFAALAVAAAVLLFGPLGLIAALGATKLLESYRPWIGLVFLVASLIVLARVLEWSARKISKWWTTRLNLKRWVERLETLSPAEATVLAGYVHGNTRTLYFQPSDGVIGGLEAEHIIFQSSNIGDMVNGFSYNIQPWALRHLKRNPTLLSEADLDRASQHARDADAVRLGPW